MRAIRAIRGEEGSGSFLKKRTKKLLLFWRMYLERCHIREKIEVFLLLFVHKKKALLSPAVADFLTKPRVHRIGCA
jgi:hypothetical protein